MTGFGSAQLVGRCVSRPELKDTRSGMKVANMSIAFDDSPKTSTFVEVTMWNKTAELACQYLRKGRMVGIEGSLKQERWKTADGENRSKLVVIASRIHFMPDSGPREEAGPDDEFSEPIAEVVEIEEMEEIPF